MVQKINTIKKAIKKAYEYSSERTILVFNKYKLLNGANIQSKKDLSNIIKSNNFNTKLNEFSNEELDLILSDFIKINKFTDNFLKALKSTNNNKS